MFSIKTTFFFTLFGLVAAYAQDFNPKYANDFLNMGVGADALGMGSAVVADAKGLTAGVWNPAGLLQQKQTKKSGSCMPPILAVWPLLIISEFLGV